MGITRVSDNPWVPGHDVPVYYPTALANRAPHAPLTPESAEVGDAGASRLSWRKQSASLHSSLGVPGKGRSSALYDWPTTRLRRV